MPYSAGITTVTNSTPAATAARMVDLMSLLVEGSSLSSGLFELYILIIP
jgi:hypothetical protein